MKKIQQIQGKESGEASSVNNSLTSLDAVNLWLAFLAPCLPPSLVFFLSTELWGVPFQHPVRRGAEGKNQQCSLEGTASHCDLVSAAPTLPDTQLRPFIHICRAVGWYVPPCVNVRCACRALPILLLLCETVQKDCSV